MLVPLITTVNSAKSPQLVCGAFDVPLQSLYCLEVTQKPVFYSLTGLYCGD